LDDTPEKECLLIGSATQWGDICCSWPSKDTHFLYKQNQLKVKKILD